MDRSIKSVNFMPFFTLLMLVPCYGMNKNGGDIESGRPPVPVFSPRSAATLYGTPARVIKSPVVDLESQQVKKESCCHAVSAGLARCAHSVAESATGCWGKLPRGAKDAIELAGLSVIDIIMVFYGAESGNSYFPDLVAYAIGETGSGITDRQKYYKKVLASAAILGTVQGIKAACGLNLWTVTTSVIMGLMHATFEEYAKISGRKNTFTEDFRELPAHLQEMVVERLSRLANQVRAIKRKQHDIPLETRVSMETAGLSSDMV